MENSHNDQSTDARTRSVLLKELRTEERPPSVLLETLAARGFTTLQVKQAMAQLLDEAKIELTDNRILRTR